MASKYKVNPVKATCIKYPGTKQDLIDINDTCFGICAAFSGTTDVFNMDPACSKACTEFVEQRKREIFGVGSCDHQAPYRPVIWDQIPRFVPQLLQKGLPLSEAKRQCMQMCKNVPMLDLECMELCTLDANAVEESVPESPFVPKNLPLSESPRSEPSPPPEEDHSKMWLWILFSFLVFVTILIVINLRK
jgi:hypothetical protein